MNLYQELKNGMYATLNGGEDVIIYIADEDDEGNYIIAYEREFEDEDFKVTQKKYDWKMADEEYYLSDEQIKELKYRYWDDLEDYSTAKIKLYGNYKYYQEIFIDGTVEDNTEEIEEYKKNIENMKSKTIKDIRDHDFNRDYYIEEIEVV